MASASLDHNLPLQQRLRMRVHLLICYLCRRYHEQITFLHDALRSHPERLEDQVLPNTPSSLSPESRDRIKRALSGT